MVTYKKRGFRNRASKGKLGEIETKSTTASVFNSLDEGSSRTQKWVEKNQNIILYAVAFICISVLAFFGYTEYVVKPNENEALNKMFNAQKMFEEASLINNDSLYNLSLNGFENNLGMLDIIEEYQNTSASNIAKYYSGISYLAMDNYKLAIKYLSDFHSDDLLLSSLAKGSIGDAFSELNQFEDAYTYYLKAAKTNSDFTSPMYLKKAGLISIKLKKYSSAKEHFENIKINFPKSNEAKNIDALISMSEASIQ